MTISHGPMSHLQSPHFIEKQNSTDQTIIPTTYWRSHLERDGRLVSFTIRTADGLTSILQYYILILQLFMTDWILLTQQTLTMNVWYNGVSLFYCYWDFQLMLKWFLLQTVKQILILYSYCSQTNKWVDDVSNKKGWGYVSLPVFETFWTTGPLALCHSPWLTTPQRSASSIS